MKKERISQLYGYGIAIIGLGMMFYGVFRGELSIVFHKAINICLECVGIG